MKRFHQIFGITLAVVFLLTGQFMHFYRNHLHDMADGMRLLYRSRHIYILFAALLNLGIGAYFVSRVNRWRWGLQLLGSGLIVVASLLFVVAFFYEPNLANLEIPYSRWGVFAIAAGALLHFVSAPRGSEISRDRKGDRS